MEQLTLWGRDNQIGQWTVSGSIGRMTDDIDGFARKYLRSKDPLDGASLFSWR